jgi:hypothetical protein
MALGAMSVVGLASALVADGPGDALAWIALGVPVAVAAWCALRRQAWVAIDQSRLSGPPSIR